MTTYKTEINLVTTSPYHVVIQCIFRMQMLMMN